jgi:hypothetical protein
MQFRFAPTAFLSRCDIGNCGDGSYKQRTRTFEPSTVLESTSGQKGSTGADN